MIRSIKSMKCIPCIPCIYQKLCQNKLVGRLFLSIFGPCHVGKVINAKVIAIRIKA